MNGNNNFWGVGSPPLPTYNDPWLDTLAKFPFESGYEEGLNNKGIEPIPIDDYSLGADISNWFTGNYDKIKDLYQNYYTNYMLGYNEYLENTRYQRAYKDLMNAGLNPYLLISQGSVSPAGGGSYSPSSSYQSSFKDSRGNDLFQAILKIAGIVAIAGKMFGGK